MSNSMPSDFSPTISRRDRPQPPERRGLVSLEPSGAPAVRIFYPRKQEAKLKRIFITAAIVASAVSLSTLAMAQGGPAAGAVGGAVVGGAVGGPVGAAVGAAAGAAAGGIADDARPRFHSYVVGRRRPASLSHSAARGGRALPGRG